MKQIATAAMPFCFRAVTRCVTAASSSASRTLPCTSTRSGTVNRSDRGTSGCGFSMVRSYWS